MSLSDLNKLIADGNRLTPMMEQYYEIKKKNPDALLFFRMGDFYELFFEDAKSAHKHLNITLTHRGKIGETAIPMAGIPHHAAAQYIDRLTSIGLKVAICEQIEAPGETPGIVKRGITQIVSPGLPYDYDKGAGAENRFIVSTFYTEGQYYILALDFTTGEFIGFADKLKSDFIVHLKKISAKEFISFMGQWMEEADTELEIEKILKEQKTLKTYLSEEYFNAKYTRLSIEKLIPGFSNDRYLKKHRGIINPIGALSYYIVSTQGHLSFTHIQNFRLLSEDAEMKVTLPTLEGLEILPRSKDQYKNSLLGFFDHTQTPMGSRLLKNYFLHPINDKKQIEERHDAIDLLKIDPIKLQEHTAILSEIRDIDRIMAKVSLLKINSGDFLSLAQAIGHWHSLQEIISKIPIKKESIIKDNERQSLFLIKQKIEMTINDEIGASYDKGNLIKEGINAERDRLASIAKNISDHLLKFEEKLRSETGISKLKIKTNNVNGFFIEISKGASHQAPSNFKRRQTLINAERYTTPELEKLERETLTAQSKLEQLEREIFRDIIDEISKISSLFKKLAIQIAELDVLISFTFLAINENFTRPKINNEIKIFSVKGGFHPLIKSILKDQFIGHDLILNENCFFGLITGPNMAGKTTVMREMAIIQFLTQIGSFVPAISAELSLCDFLFSRLGASDNILAGQSTFMVEMSEAAEIVRHATAKSFIVLDEIGRGTSTYDGLAIAWGLVEHFVTKTKALALFATHYHELIEVAEKLSGAKNLTVETINQNGNVQFLYRLIEKPASQSFGIYVAKLAGLPSSILKRSSEILLKLEKNQNTKQLPSTIDDRQLCLLTEIDNNTKHNNTSILATELNNLDLNKLTPLDAMIFLDKLKKTSQTLH